MPKNEDIAFRGFKVTISTKSPVTIDDDKIFQKYCAKKCDMFHIVAEHGSNGKRHLHILMCCKVACFKRNLCDTLWKLIKENHSDSKQGIAVRCDVLYNNVWYDTYLNKESDHEVVYTNYDASLEVNYYATPEQQEYLQARITSSSAVDPYYSKLSTEFESYWSGRTGVPLRGDCIQYLQYRMFVVKDMRCIRDPKAINQIGVTLWRYFTSNADLDFEQRKYCASLDGPIVNFDGEGYVSHNPIGNPTGCKSLWCEKVFK